MKRIQINAIIDIFSLITFIPSLISGLVLFFVLPGGLGLGPVSKTRAFLGLTRDQWTGMHDVWSLAFAALVIIHFALHWRFYRNIVKCLRSADRCEVDR